jgi:glycolate oxidase
MRREVLRKLRSIVGESHVLTSRDDLICYAYDAQLIEGLPEAVVEPRTPDEVSRVLRLANDEGFPVIPRGAGTGLSGGSVPVKGGVVLTTHRMNRILEIDMGDLTATVEPGVVTRKLCAEAESLGLFYPPDPGSYRVSTLGGNVATNAGGPHALKYGVTGDYVLGLEVVLPTGRPITAGASTVKSVAGYNLSSIFIGSEGTLGVVTKIKLKLLPKPEARYTLLAAFGDIESSARVVSKVIASGIIPAALEFMDRVTVNAVEDYIKAGMPRDAEAVLLIETDGHPAAAREEAEKIVGICEESGASVRFAEKEEERERLWKARRAALPALSRIRSTTLLEDATVPRSKVPEMVAEIKRIAEKYGVIIGIFGHAGDGNLHPTILLDLRDRGEKESMEKAMEEIFSSALSLGGTLSGEHGIGVAKARYLEREVGEAGLEVMKAIKKAFDPNNILNPGKIFT